MQECDRQIDDVKDYSDGANDQASDGASDQVKPERELETWRNWAER